MNYKPFIFSLLAALIVWAIFPVNYHSYVDILLALWIGFIYAEYHDK